MVDYPVDPECIFCKIISQSIPCAKVYEDKHILAFLDINPIKKGHTLVIPKGHYPTLLDIPNELGEHLIPSMKRVASAVMEATNASGFNCLQNNFSAAGQVVFHLHWHIIPRFSRDELPIWPHGEYSQQEELQDLARSINEQILP